MYAFGGSEKYTKNLNNCQLVEWKATLFWHLSDVQQLNELLRAAADTRD